MQRQAGGRPFAYDPVARRIQVDHRLIAIEDVREEWERRPDHDRQSWLESRIADLLTQNSTVERPDDDHLLLALRSRSELEGHRIAGLRGGPTGESVPALDLTPDVALTVVAEHDRIVIPITDVMLDEWGLQFRDAFPVALNSLRSRHHNGWSVGADSVAITAVDDLHAAARFCIPGELEALEFGRPVESFVVIPSHRHRCVVCPADDPRAIVAAFERVLADPDRSALVCSWPLVGRNGNWARLELPPEHPGYLGWRRLTRMQIERTANDLAPAVQDLVGEEIFVASVVFRESSRRGLETVTTWTEGVPSLLPRTDAIAFARSTATEPLVVPWDAAHAVVGSMMEPTMHQPERYRVQSFPEQTVLMQLAAAV